MANSIHYHRLSNTQVALHTDNSVKTLTLTYVPGWNGGGNNYSSPRWVIHEPRNIFPLRTFPATRNNLRKMPDCVMEYLTEYFGE